MRATILTVFICTQCDSGYQAFKELLQNCLFFYMLFTHLSVEITSSLKAKTMAYFSSSPHTAQHEAKNNAGNQKLYT